MNRAFLILTLAAILLQSFSKGFIWLGFEFNKEFIAQNICVKKADKNNCCKGRCELKKQLLNDDKQEKEPTQTQKEKGSEQSICQTVQLFCFKQLIIQKEFQEYKCVVSPEPTIAIFHPPPTFVSC